MQQPHEDSNFSMTLREHLLNTQAQQPLSLPQPHHESSHSPPQQHQHHIDPAISPPGYTILSHDDDDTNMEDQSPDVRKGRRELSTSKRAAQNRAAQRAFRQRKEAYINSLQEKVREYEGLIGNYKAIQQENFQLREYIIQLQSKLIGDIPPVPSNIDLHNPPDRSLPKSPTPHHHAPTEPVAAQPVAPMGSDGAEQLRVAAAAAAHAAAVDENDQSKRDGNGESETPHRTSTAGTTSACSAPVAPAAVAGSPEDAKMSTDASEPPP